MGGVSVFDTSNIQMFSYLWCGNNTRMSDKAEILQAIAELRAEMNAGFKSVNKRLDGVEHELALVKLELKKIDTVLGYQQQYDNIPS